MRISWILSQSRWAQSWQISLLRARIRCFNQVLSIELLRVNHSRIRWQTRKIRAIWDLLIKQVLNSIRAILWSNILMLDGKLLGKKSKGRRLLEWVQMKVFLKRMNSSFLLTWQVAVNSLLFWFNRMEFRQAECKNRLKPEKLSIELCVKQEMSWKNLRERKTQ